MTINAIAINGGTSMCPEQALKRKNIKKILNRSVASNEIDSQQKELANSERKLNQAGDNVSKIKDKVDQARQRLIEVRNQHRTSKTKQAQRAITSANNRLQIFRQDLDDKRAIYRELMIIVREQKSMVKSLEKKEAAKQKAVAKFLKDWERDYDHKMHLTRSNVQKRKRALSK